MKVGGYRHPRVWFAAAPPGGPRSNPVSYYRAGLGPGTVERESGKSRWRAGQARIFFWRLLWRATPPHVWGNGKRDGQIPSPTKAGAAQACLFDIEYDERVRSRLARVFAHALQSRKAKERACARIG